MYVYINIVLISKQIHYIGADFFKRNSCEEWTALLITDICKFKYVIYIIKIYYF
jgi:hypothetical protein